MENVTMTRGRERAQAIIIAAFLVAIGVLVLSVFLNGLIFSQNLATRDEGAEERNIMEFTQGTEEAVRAAMTGNRTTPADAEDEFDLFMHVYEEQVRKKYVRRQSAASVGPTGLDSDLNLSDVDSTTVWALGQRCGVSPTSGSGKCTFVNSTTTSPEWQVINDSEAFDGDSPYKMEFNVTRPVGTDIFVANTTDSDAISFPPPFSGSGWRMEVNNNSIVFSQGADFPFGSSSSYSWSDIDEPYARIEVIEERINNQTKIGGNTVNTQKGALDSDIEQMVFEGADTVEGTYDIRIDKNTPQDKIQGPCQTTPDVCELVRTDDRDLYAVGIVHEVDGVRANYTDADVTHASEIGVTLRQEDLILEDR